MDSLEGSVFAMMVVMDPHHNRPTSSGAILEGLKGLSSWLFSGYAWCSLFLHMVFYMPPIAAALRYRPGAAFWLARWMARSLLASMGIQLEIQGLEHLDPGRRYLYVCNHSSRLDPFLLAASLPHRAIGIEHDTNFRYPFYGPLISSWGNIPISHEYHAQAKAALERAAELYRQGMSLVIFPEGKLSRTATMGPCKEGGFRLAVQTGAEVVPTVIRGAFAVSPGHSWMIRPGRVTVHFGVPLFAGHMTISILQHQVCGWMSAASQGQVAGPASGLQRHPCHGLPACRFGAGLTLGPGDFRM